MNNKKSILIVEDNVNEAELTMAALSLALQEEHLDDRVVVTRDGAEALDYLHREGKFEMRDGGDPSVVLLDINMPKVNGLEVLRQIKTDPALKNIPVVMLTSSSEEEDLLKSYDLGANAYVVKPVDYHRFVEAIKQLASFWGLINAPPPAALARMG